MVVNIGFGSQPRVRFSWFQDQLGQIFASTEAKSKFASHSSLPHADYQDTSFMPCSFLQKTNQREPEVGRKSY